MRRTARVLLAVALLAGMAVAALPAGILGEILPAAWWV